MIVESPTIEVVNQGGEPVWRVSGLGMSVCDRCGARARELWEQMATARGYRGPMADRAA
jgi:hypothetical protein